jgi:hypothetical protein
MRGQQVFNKEGDWAKGTVVDAGVEIDVDIDNGVEIDVDAGVEIEVNVDDGLRRRRSSSILVHVIDVIFCWPGSLSLLLYAHVNDYKHYFCKPTFLSLRSHYIHAQIDYISFLNLRSSSWQTCQTFKPRFWDLVSDMIASPDRDCSSMLDSYYCAHVE